MHVQGTLLSSAFLQSRKQMLHTVRLRSANACSRAMHEIASQGPRPGLNHITERLYGLCVLPRGQAMPFVTLSLIHI